LLKRKGNIVEIIEDSLNYYNRQVPKCMMV